MIQKLKQKFLIILPYWLLILILTITVQSSFTILSFNSERNNNQEQVLGAETNIRGKNTDDSKLAMLTKTSEPDFSMISAKSFLVFNLSSGQNLAEKSIQTKLPIASLTKLLTSLVAYENIDLNFEMMVTQEDLNQVKPNLNLKVGDRIKLLDLFNTMLIGSSNDSATALANIVSKTTGKKFVDLMNNLAQTIGLKNSNFSNPMGFDSQFNYSTAEDLKKLIITTENLAVYTNLGRRLNYEFTSLNGTKYNIKATNKLISTNPDLEAIKTGFTEGAKGSMAVKVNINGKSIIFIVLGSNDRESDTLKLKEIITKSYNFN